MGCTCNKEVVPYYDQKQICADLENTQKDQVFLFKLLNDMHPNIGATGDFAKNVVSTDEGQRIVIAFKDRKFYERVATALAILSHKDPSSLTTMNLNSVNDTPQLHLPEDLVSSSRENIVSYTNEKGYSKVLHLIHHGSLAKTPNSYYSEFSYYVEAIATGLKMSNDFNVFHGMADKNVKNPGLYATTKWNYEATRRVLKDILYGIKYLHDRNIACGRIKVDKTGFDMSGDTLDRVKAIRDSDDCCLVLMDYTNICCLNPNSFKSSINGNWNKDADIEQKWQDMMENSDLIEQSIPVAHSAPETGFGRAFLLWQEKKHGKSKKLNKLSAEEKLDDLNQFSKIMRQRYNETLNTKSWPWTDQYLELQQRYNPERLFGMTWQERYKQWKNYDTLPVLENDDLNKDVFQRLQLRTPRMFKASDIWMFGVTSYALYRYNLPFRVSQSNADTLERIISREYTSDFKLLFKVE